MPILQIEHQVQNYDAWKRAFDSDPAGRERSGVRRYRVLRPVENPTCVQVELEFDSLGEAEAFLLALRKLWQRVDGQLIEGPRARMVEAVEAREY